MSVTVVSEYVFYFAVYSFIGFLLENSFSWARTRVFWKDGFLYSPHKPMYGLAPVILLLAQPVVPLWVLIALCFVVPTGVELLSGLLLKHSFNRRYWDYTDLPLQYGGYICLIFSLAWLVLCAFTLFVLHPGMVILYRLLEPVWLVLAPYFLIYLMLDLYLAMRKEDRHAMVGE